MALLVLMIYFTQYYSTEQETKNVESKHKTINIQLCLNNTYWIFGELASLDAQAQVRVEDRRCKRQGGAGLAVNVSLPTLL